MQYDVNSPSAFINILQEDWRKEIVLEIREIIFSKANDIEEGIQYKMLSYGYDGKTIFHLNAQKNYVSLYVGDIQKIDTDGSLLKGINQGKGCVRLKKSNQTSEPGIGEFIERTIAYWKEGGDIGC